MRWSLRMNWLPPIPWSPEGLGKLTRSMRPNSTACVCPVTVAVTLPSSPMVMFCASGGSSILLASSVPSASDSIPSAFSFSEPALV